MTASHSRLSVFQELKSKRFRITITTHYNPDGDAIGSSLGLYHVLKGLGHEVTILIPNDLPDFLQWMPGLDQIVVFQHSPDQGSRLLAEAEYIFCLDYNALHRVRLFEHELRAATCPRILVDHHLQPENEFSEVHSTNLVSSTSELIYSLIQHYGLDGFVNKQVAECLFVGIMTDTGSFSYSCNSSATFEIVGDLIRHGLDPGHIHRLVYDTYSESRMRLLGHCLANKLQVRADSATAFIWLSRDELNQFNYQQGDTEGVVNYALSIKGVALAALFTERDDRIRVSLRSKGDFSVNEMARSHFNGGGHRNAAGGDLFMPMPEALTFFENLLPTYRNNILEALKTESSLRYD